MTQASPSTSTGTRPWGKIVGSPKVVRFLEGPQRRGFELARALHIFFEFLRGFRVLHFVGPCVTVFGSARFHEAHPHYRLAREIGSRLARAGFTVITGGGPGNTTTFLSIYLVKLATMQFDVGPAAAFSLIYFLIVLLFSFAFYQALLNVGRGEKA